ncbi:MAG: APC family permease [Elusimicrobia bacterium HGW-Elusimicrobia-3]|nr:MAG: APC family permease [Elusimicrobia bacterium HGW-Elusimicrobia-3]
MVPNQRFKQVFVLSTAMLSFISFWKAAAIVLCDFGSSAYYSGGIAMRAYGPAFPWFVLGVMLFAGVMLAVYVESCSMFVRGGVYVVVRHAMGKFLAKIAVSSLVFDYVLTGPISAISAGLYISYLAKSLLEMAGMHFPFSPNILAVVFGVAVIAYFWKENIKGVKESGDTNVKIVLFVAAIAAVLLVWSFITIYVRGFTLPPFKLEFSEEALGWSKHFSWLKPIGMIGIFMAFGHSILALSGLESMAQVYREIEDPKVPNLKRTAIIVFIFSVLFTGVLTFLSSLIIPAELVAGEYSENLLSGLALHLHGPYLARLALQILVVISGGLILMGAVNTSFVGANGILNRVAEDGILHDWFRKLHPKYGTTSRIITMVAALQIVIIIISRGNIFLLGQAYAFGVLWSLVFDTLSLVVLRFKEADMEREFMFPLNIRVKRYQVPVGLMSVLVVLLITGVMNLITKPTATVAGLIFTAVFFTIFQVSEKMNEKKAQLYKPDEDKDEELNLRRADDIHTVVPELTKARRVLVPVRNPNNLHHLTEVLETADDETTDIIVLSAKIAKGIQSGGETMSDEDKEVFSAVVLLAEKYGKTVKPIFVFSNDPFFSMAQVAQAAGVDEIVMGVSGSTGAEVQMERLAMAWGMLKKPDAPAKPVLARVVWEGRQMTFQLS